MDCQRGVHLHNCYCLGYGPGWCENSYLSNDNLCIAMSDQATRFYILLLTVEVFVPDAQSLKQRRSAIKGLKDRIRARFNVSVSELDLHDKWQRAVIGICLLGNSRRAIDSDADKICQLCQQAAGIELADIGRDWP